MINKYLPTLFLYTVIFCSGLLVSNALNIKNKASLSSFETYQILEDYRDAITDYKALYFKNELNYKVYRDIESSIDRMYLLFKDCDSVLDYIEKGEVIVEASNSNALTNKIIYPFYYENLRALSLECGS